MPPTWPSARRGFWDEVAALGGVMQRIGGAGRMVGRAKEGLMKRLLLNLVAVACGVLALPLVVIGIRSYWVTERVFWRSNDGEVSMGMRTLHGAVDILRIVGGLDSSEYQREGGHPLRLGGPGGSASLKWSLLGCSYYSGDDIFYGYRGSYGQRKRPYWELIVPLWMPAVLFGGIGGWCIYRANFFARRKCAAGCCRKCGYDLRAHQPGERCPECGMAKEDVEQSRNGWTPIGDRDNGNVRGKETRP
jgi:hypothetical protein